MIALSDYLSLKELTTSHVQTQSDTVMTVLSDVDLRLRALVSDWRLGDGGVV